jgi:hypothetical protein
MHDGQREHEIEEESERETGAAAAAEGGEVDDEEDSDVDASDVDVDVDREENGVYTEIMDAQGIATGKVTGAWTETEKRNLIQSVKESGLNWNAHLQAVPSRTLAQLKNFYHSHNVKEIAAREKQGIFDHSEIERKYIYQRSAIKVSF